MGIFIIYLILQLRKLTHKAPLTCHILMIRKMKVSGFEFWLSLKTYSTPLYCCHRVYWGGVGGKETGVLIPQIKKIGLFCCLPEKTNVTL